MRERRESKTKVFWRRWRCIGKVSIFPLIQWIIKTASKVNVKQSLETVRTTRMEGFKRKRGGRTRADWTGMNIIIIAEKSKCYCYIRKNIYNEVARRSQRPLRTQQWKGLPTKTKTKCPPVCLWPCVLHGWPRYDTWCKMPVNSAVFVQGAFVKGGTSTVEK